MNLGREGVASKRSEAIEQERGVDCLIRAMRATVKMLNGLKGDDVDRIIEMAWEDRTPFDAIFAQFGLSENEVRAVMRKFMKRSSFEMWRKRVKGRSMKHARHHTEAKPRFRSPNQRSA